MVAHLVWDQGVAGSNPVTPTESLKSNLGRFFCFYGFALTAGTTNPAALSFRYGGDTTEVDEIESENGKVKTIYDLQGRKLSEITEPGIYIVNGKKVFVK